MMKIDVRFLVCGVTCVLGAYLMMFITHLEHFVPPHNNHPSLFPPPSKSCVARLSEEGLFSNWEIKTLARQLCNPSNFQLFDLIRQDRINLRKMERKDYLHNDVRSYRLSGLICNNGQDESVPKVASPVAFKCLPRDYRQKACMDGRVLSPESCGQFRQRANETPVDTLRLHGPYRGNDDSAMTTPKSDCDAPGAQCKSTPVGEPGRTTIDAGQLSDGLADSRLLHMRSDQRPMWTTPVLDFLLQMLADNKDISPKHYPRAHAALQNAMLFSQIKDERVLVLGSISPWVESLALHLGVATSPTLTVDYNTPVSTDARLHVQRMDEMLQDFDVWPLMISYSSVEHDGQGRYGDPLDPDGDLAAMKEYWLKLAPGGTFLLGVPFGTWDKFEWYSQRKYGPARLPLLTRGWEYGGLATSDKVYNADEEFVVQNVKDKSPVLILRKPAVKKGGRPQHRYSLDKLDVNAPGGLQCNHLGRCSGAMLRGEST